jgi:hypothetical protein
VNESERIARRQLFIGAARSLADLAQQNWDTTLPGITLYNARNTFFL